MFKNRLKRVFVNAICLSLIFTAFTFFEKFPKAKADAPFAYGADIGWLKQMEDEGVRWLDDGGKQKDALQILKDHGINAVRLRVFVNPPSSYYWLKDGTTWSCSAIVTKRAYLRRPKGQKR